MRPAKTALAAALAVVTAACSATGSAQDASAPSASCKPPETPTLTLAAYSTPREVYGKIIPAFQAAYEEQTGKKVIFQESYGGSTTQAQNVINGFEADVVALSLAPDVDVLVDAGLITHDWTQAPDGGMVSTSVVVFDVRPGNPLEIDDFDDLARDGTEVLTPDPASSGGARWNIVAAYGAALRGHAGNAKGDQQGATEPVADILANVIAFDKSARDSIKNFEAGNGDVAITYENEVLTAQRAGLADEMVIPPSTVLIENPVAVVDAYAEKHCVRDVAEAFVEFLHTEEAKQLYTEVGFLRPTDPAAAQRGGKGFAPIRDLFTVEDLGGWDALNAQFEPGGAFADALQEALGG